MKLNRQQLRKLMLSEAKRLDALNTQKELQVIEKLKLSILKNTHQGKH